MPRWFVRNASLREVWTVSRLAPQAASVLHWPSMRILAVLAVAIVSMLSVGCADDGVMLQPPVQGEWSNFHNDKHQVSKDAREAAEKPPAEK